MVNSSRRMRRKATVIQKLLQKRPFSHKTLGLKYEAGDFYETLEHIRWIIMHGF